MTTTNEILNNCIDANRLKNNIQIGSNSNKLKNMHGSSKSNKIGSNTAKNANASSCNWFKSIPQRIRKFITKNHRYTFKHSSEQLNQSRNGLAKSTTSIETTQIENIDGNDDSNLYSMVEYLGNDEEVAMIRACSQMAR